MAVQESAGKFKIEVDGTEVPKDVDNLLTSAIVDSNLHQPDLFVLIFSRPRPGRPVENGGKDRFQGQGDAPFPTPPRPATSSWRGTLPPSKSNTTVPARSPCCAVMTNRTCCSEAVTPRRTRT